MADTAIDKKQINEIKGAILQAIPNGANSVLLMRALIQILETQKQIVPQAWALAERAENKGE